MVAARMNQTLIDIARADNSRGGHIMVVSHGNAMKFFMHSVFPEKLKFNGNHGTVYNTEDGEQLRIDNTDMIVLTYDHIREEVEFMGAPPGQYRSAEASLTELNTESLL
ncbi:MAG: hypothetical protein H6618_00305 [Deltaproteobacteria bacterium]|nr:hypothetical protein [Deltaproteobacteria bacterium]